MNLEIIKDKIFKFKNLSITESEFIFNLIMSGEMDEIEISAILVALKMKTESKNEIN